MPETYFNLSEGETIVREMKPESRLKYYYFFNMLLPVIPIFIMLAIYRLMFQPSAIEKIYGIGFMKEIYFNAIYLFPIVLIAIGFLSANKYAKEHYWITNKRIVYKRGMFGYRITSIPYERVSDVMISKTFTEQIFGISSLHVQSLAGQVTGAWQGSGLGAEGSLNAIENPEETQELIFTLIKQKRKDEHLSF